MRISGPNPEHLLASTRCGFGSWSLVGISTTPALKQAFNLLVFPVSIRAYCSSTTDGVQVPQIQVPLYTQGLGALGVPEALEVPRSQECRLVHFSLGVLVSLCCQGHPVGKRTG